MRSIAPAHERLTDAAASLVRKRGRASLERVMDSLLDQHYAGHHKIGKTKGLGALLSALDEKVSRPRGVMTDTPQPGAAAGNPSYQVYAAPHVGIREVVVYQDKLDPMATLDIYFDDGDVLSYFFRTRVEVATALYHHRRPDGELDAQVIAPNDQRRAA